MIVVLFSPFFVETQIFTGAMWDNAVSSCDMCNGDCLMKRATEWSEALNLKMYFVENEEKDLQKNTS